MREGGVRGPGPLERADGQRLAADLDGSPLRGRPLRRRLRNFRLGVDTYVASLGGPLPYMQRLREIELRTAAHEARLAEAWRSLAAACDGDGAAFGQRWRDEARAWRFDELNELIEGHNRYYPIEARLPMDPRTGDYVLVAGKRYARRPLDGGWVLERFPPALELARPPT